MPPTGKRVDPYSNFRFLVEIGGISYGMFRECTGFMSEIAIIENPQGGVFEMQKLPGRVKYSNIVLKWGLTDSTDLYNWHADAIKGQIQRKNGSIVVLDSLGKEKVRWNFFSGWPSKYDAPDFNASSDDIAIETLEIAIERLERA